MSKCEFFKNEIAYLGHLISGKGIFPMNERVKAITDSAPASNITEAKHVIGLTGYYRKFFPIFSDMIQQINKLTRKNVPFTLTELCQ